MPLSKAQGAWPIFITLLAILSACLFWGLRPTNQRPRPDDNRREPTMRVADSNRPANVLKQAQQLSGQQAQRYLEQPGEGQSLMQAVTAARFGLQPQEHAPFSKQSSTGYLGISHDQNLNAWFDAEGITVRPTVSEKELQEEWKLGFSLKAYGYGEHLQAAPPITSQIVKDNRIEYVRGNVGLANPDFGLTSNLTLHPQSTTGKPQLVEWYENRSEGIEQGFTINERPMRGSEVATAAPLHLSLGVSGDLRARLKDEGRAIYFVDVGGKTALSYSKLQAMDSTGQMLAVRMEASAEGREISLVVNDRAAVYPIVIDPLVASLEQKLDASGNRQLDARFGYAVAVDGNTAVVGAWREDVPNTALVDAGAVYTFSRSGNGWSSASLLHLGDGANSQCGWSVAIASNYSSAERETVFGCPGAINGLGQAFVTFPGQKIQIVRSGLDADPGDKFGFSVDIDEDQIVVGAPFDDSGGADSGTVYTWNIDAGGIPHPYQTLSNSTPGAEFGSSVATHRNVILVGSPSEDLGIDLPDAGTVKVFERPDGGGWSQRQTLTAAGARAGDSFGNSVGVSYNTAVIGAPNSSSIDKGNTKDGAAYVFERGTNGAWSQQQKLLASDGRSGDLFGEHAVAIDGSTIVVGAYAQDGGVSNPDDNRGAVYVFTRNGTSWIQQTKINPSLVISAPADQFGIGVGISGDTVIVGARAAAATDFTAHTGAAFVYRLDCTAPYLSQAYFRVGAGAQTALGICYGSSVHLESRASGANLRYQWRKDGRDIPLATASTYVINSALVSDLGTYDALISNSCGSMISSAATLTSYNYNISPSSQTFTQSGGTGAVTITSTGNCGGTGTSNASWITITSTSAANGTGNSNIIYAVAANPGATQRTGTITIADKTFTVSQNGTALVSNVQFNASSYSVGEGAGVATITVTRTADTSGAVTVDYATSDLVAEQRTDYAITAGTLTFAPGETSKTFDVLIVDDNYVEGSETVSLTLSNPSGGAVLGAPSSATLTITDNDSISPTINPLDNANQQFFVRQHFYDFLSRSPDPGGFDFWVGQITQCGNNQTCLNNKRLDVSNAFFFELEYQQTGAYVFRLYRAAFGNNQPFPNPDTSNLAESKKLPAYSVFAPDRARVVGGASLAIGQQSIANAFVQRGAFLARYPSQNGPTFVDAVLATILNDTGVNLTSQRAALITLFNSGGRGAVMYRLANDDAQGSNGGIDNHLFTAEEYNRAFVATQYFGYLRRDADIGGFLFWLGQVNSAPPHDTTKHHAMVCAFITAAEYQQRFSSVVMHSNAECSQ